MFSSLYIHVPFCRQKCDYCAFASIAGADDSLRKAYIARLAEEFEGHSAQCAPLDSLFVGGGTPSLLTVSEWETLFGLIHTYFKLAPHYEWSMEANPESLTPELIRCWAQNGVNRVSIGIQAFQENLRKTLGRHGELTRLPQIVDALHHNQIHRLNFDLIFNIPGQTLTDWKTSLAQALSFGPTHISTYALTLEEGTRLAQRISPLSDDGFLEFWNASDECLTEFHRYEISNFARDNEECRHNYAIWKGATYLGCGPAATSFDGKDRWTQPSHIRDWLQKIPPEIDTLPPPERAAEILAFGMRTTSGWNWKEFQKTTGFNALELRENSLKKLQKQGLITLTDAGTAPTPQGLLFNDEILMELL